MCARSKDNFSVISRQCFDDIRITCTKTKQQVNKNVRLLIKVPNLLILSTFTWVNNAKTWHAKILATSCPQVNIVCASSPEKIWDFQYCKILQQINGTNSQDQVNSFHANPKASITLELPFHQWSISQLTDSEQNWNDDGIKWQVYKSCFNLFKNS